MKRNANQENKMTTTKTCDHGYAAANCPVCETARMVEYDGKVRARLARESAEREAKGIVEHVCG